MARCAHVPGPDLDLRFTPAAGTLPRRRAGVAHRPARRRVRGGARARRPGRRARAVRRALGVGAGARPRRLDRPRLARRVRRPRRDARRAGHLLRGVRARRRAGPGRHHRRGPARADDRALRHRRAEAPVPARHPRAAPRSGARATPNPTPAPTSPTCRRAPSATATSGCITGQKVWTSLAHWAQWIFVLCRTNRDAPKHKGLSYLLVPMDQPGHRDPADRADHRPQRVQRDVLRRRAHAGRECRRRGRRRLAGRDGNARVRARRVDARPAARVRAASCARSPSSRATNGAAADPRVAAAARRRVDHAARDALPRAAHAADARARRRWRRATSIHKLSGRRSTAGSASSRSTCCGAGAASAARRRPPARACSSTPAPTRSTAARTRSRRNVIGEQALGLPKEPTMTHTVAPDTRAGHGPARGQDRARHRGRGHRHRVRDREALRRGRRARRDQRHPRTAAARGGRRSSACTRVLANVTVGGRRRSAASTRASSVRRRHLDVLVNNAGLGGTARLAEMTDEQWFVGARRHAHRHDAHDARRAAAHGRRAVGRDRQQRVGRRLARAGGPVALRGREGGRDGADPLRGDRGGVARACA